MDVAAPAEECFALLAAVDRYPDWCPEAVRDVQVLDRGPDDQPTLVRMGIRVARGPIVREFHLSLAVAVEAPRSVALTRVADHPTNQEFTAIWRLRPAGGTQITLQLNAELRVPAYISGAGLGDEIARAFVAAAARALAVPAT